MLLRQQFPFIPLFSSDEKGLSTKNRGEDHSYYPDYSNFTDSILGRFYQGPIFIEFMCLKEQNRYYRFSQIDCELPDETYFIINKNLFN